VEEASTEFLSDAEASKLIEEKAWFGAGVDILIPVNFLKEPHETIRSRPFNEWRIKSLYDDPTFRVASVDTALVLIDDVDCGSDLRVLLTQQAFFDWVAAKDERLNRLNMMVFSGRHTTELMRRMSVDPNYGGDPDNEYMLRKCVVYLRSQVTNEEVLAMGGYANVKPSNVAKYDGQTFADLIFLFRYVFLCCLSCSLLDQNRLLLRSKYIALGSPAYVHHRSAGYESTKYAEYYRSCLQSLQGDQRKANFVDGYYASEQRVAGAPADVYALWEEVLIRIGEERLPELMSENDLALAKWEEKCRQQRSVSVGSLV
jgi:hypothetical protein